MGYWEVNGYNDRLFRSGVRKIMHLARFEWLRSMCAKYAPGLSCVVEFGRFDARSLDWIPQPKIYYGYDAGWEGGLDVAVEKYKSNPNFIFCKCISPNCFLENSEMVTLFISLETLEHIPSAMLEGYIKKIRASVDGYLFISVPNEKGPIFAIKQIVKVFLGTAEKYKLVEYLAASFCLMKYVQRSTTNDHKGFDWVDLRKRLEQEFSLIESKGVQFPWLPTWLNLQIGMVFRAMPSHTTLTHQSI